MSRLEPAAVAAILLALAVPAASAQELEGPAPSDVLVHMPARLVPVSPDPDWVEVSVTEVGRGYLDRRSVRAEGGRVRMVMRIVHAGNRYGVVESFNTWEIDCVARTTRVVEFDALGEGGTTIVSHVNSLEDYPWEPISEASPISALHRDHC